MKATVLFFFALLSTAVFSLSVTAEPLEVIEQWDGGVTIAIDTGTPTVNDTEISGEPFQTLTMEGFNTGGAVGTPALPRVGFTVIIPPATDISVTIEDESVVEEGTFRLLPVKPEQTDDESYQNDPVYFFDESVYGTNTSWPEKWIEEISEGWFGRLPVRTFIVTPFRYFAGSGRLLRADRLVVSFTWNNNLSDYVSPVPAETAKLYKSSILNFEEASVPIEKNSNGLIQFLFVTHPDFEVAVEPLVQWERMKGFPTEVVTIDTDDPQDVKDIFQDYYDNEDLLYGILVGDADFVPIAEWNGDEGDTWYSCLTGGISPDYYPEFGISRLSVTNPVDLDIQLDKIIKYESDPPSDGWFDKLTFVGHLENAPNPGSFVANKEEIKESVLAGLPLDIETLYGHIPGVHNSDVQTAINNGCCIVNYRGHGSTTSWAQWNTYGEYFGYSQIDALNNGNHTPVVFNIACLNGRIGTNCISEAWMGLENAAVASLGSNESSYHTANNFMDKALFDALYNEELPNISLTLVDAFVEMIPHGGYYLTSVRMYGWLGDPVTPVYYTGSPQKLVVDGPDTFEVGYNGNVVFNVHTEGGSPVKDALVSVFKKNELLEYASTDISGNAVFNLTFAEKGTVRITTTKDYYISGQTLAAVGGDGFYLAVTLEPENVVVPGGNNLSYTVTLKNMGEETVAFDYWTDAYLPSGGAYSGNPIIAPVSVSLNPGQEVSGSAVHLVPGTAPPLVIDIKGKVGNYPDIVKGGDEFSFEITE